MSVTRWFLGLFSKAVPVVEEPPNKTPLEYMEHLLDLADSDLDQPYVRASMYKKVSTRHPDIYEMIGVIDDCSTNIRQKATLPKEAIRRPPNVRIQDTILREFIVDAEGRSLGREACIRSLLVSSRKLLRELASERLNDFDKRHYEMNLELMIDEITRVLDTYLTDDEAGG